MKLVAESFEWPFRGEWRSRWAVGVLVVLFLPLLFIPLLGYAIAATRAAENDPSKGPPPWRLSARLLVDGFWTSLAAIVLTAPLALAFNPLSDFLYSARVGHAADSAQSWLFAHVIALLCLALPWGLVFLLLMPHATARFANSGRPRDLFDVVAAVHGVRRDFATWNLTAAAIVTGWAVGVACVGLLCVGLVPGVFYAILVSAHASAALNSKGASTPAR
ncbi:MAG: DUF4013 domain-containing protein [Candidatus Dormiibacterota bacterium]